jgi:hypothetical protein
MTVGTFKGRIKPLNLTEILKFLKESGKSGLLRVDSGGQWRGLYVRRGRVIVAESSLPSESLLALLLDAKRCSEEQIAVCEALVKGGVRAGRALVESGALSPSELFDWTGIRTRTIARGILCWSSGSFAFEESELPPVEWILVNLDILEVVLGALREIDDNSLFSTRLPEKGVVFEHFTYSEGGEAPPLLPHERYVLSLVNGRRDVGEIERMSELGETATRKTLGIMFLIGCVRYRRDETVEGAPVPTESSSSDVKAVIRAYNEMFAFIYSYMMKEVGPIAEHVLDKYLREVRDANHAVFSKISLSKEGTLNEEALSRNVHLVRGKNRLDVLIRGLNEFLYSGQLAVKRTLGADHEAVVVRRLNEIRKAPAPLG